MTKPDTDKLLSPWAKNISPSMTLAIDAKAKALKAQGAPVLNFAAGEPDFDTPKFIKEACKKALNEGKTKYIATAGLPALREAIAQKYGSFYNISGIESLNVIVSPGGKFSCYLAILATCSFGDEVLIPAPYWVSYPEMVKLSGATPRILPTSEASNLKITPQDLREAINEKTKLLIMNSPSNPSGMVYTKEELLEILKICQEKNVLILSDEIYEHILYEGAEHHCMASLTPGAKDIVMVVSGFSKTFSMTGWRLGTTLAPTPIANAITNLQSQTTSNANTFAQYGALAAFENPEATKESLDEMIQIFTQRRKLMLEGLNSINGLSTLPAQGAFYLFPNIEHFGLSSLDCSEKLLDKAELAVVPGIAFGTDGHIRLSYATSNDAISQGMERLSKFFKNL